jgi:hypothetical protein
MFGADAFGMPLPSGVLQALGAESVRVFEQQGQSQGQGQGQGNPCETWYPQNYSTLYADEGNNYYLIKIPNGYNGELQVVEWSGSDPEGDIPTYEGSPHNTTPINKYLSYLRYQSKYAQGMQSSCTSNQRGTYSNPGFNVLFPTGGNLWGQQSTRDANNNYLWDSTWKTAKNAHLSQFAGCNDENANNYNPQAASDDGSCTYDWVDADYTADNWNYTYKQQTWPATSDGWIFRWRMTAPTEMIKQPNNYVYRGNWEIVKECTSQYGCGEPVTAPYQDRTLPTVVLQTGQIGYPNGLSWDDFQDGISAASDAGESVIDGLKTNYQEECREVVGWSQDYSGHYKMMNCDQSSVYYIKVDYMVCDGDADIIRKEYYVLKDDVELQRWVVDVANGEDEGKYMVNQGNTSFSHAKYGGFYEWVALTEKMYDDYFESRPKTLLRTEIERKGLGGGYGNDLVGNATEERKSPTGVRPLHGGQHMMLGILYRTRNVYATDCGEKRDEWSPLTFNIYHYETTRSDRQAIPSITENDDGTLTIGQVGIGETILAETYSPIEKDEALAKFVENKAIIGCMDASASNYAPNANTNDRFPNSGYSGDGRQACKWDDCDTLTNSNLDPDDYTNPCEVCKEGFKMCWDNEKNLWSCIGDTVSCATTGPIPCSDPNRLTNDDGTCAQGCKTGYNLNDTGTYCISEGGLGDGLDLLPWILGGILIFGIL